VPVIESSEVLWVTRPPGRSLRLFQPYGFFGLARQFPWNDTKIARLKESSNCYLRVHLHIRGRIPNEEMDPPGSNTGETPPDQTVRIQCFRSTSTGPLSICLVTLSYGWRWEDNGTSGGRAEKLADRLTGCNLMRDLTGKVGLEAHKSQTSIVDRLKSSVRQR